MLKIRLIPCLDVKAGRVVKGVRFVDLRDAGDGLAAVTHSCQSAGSLQSLFLAALVCFQPHLFVSIRLPLVDRRQLRFGDQERHHVFPIVGFSFQAFTVRLCLRLAYLTAHLVLRLDLRHGREPTAGPRLGANSSGDSSCNEFPGAPGPPGFADETELSRDVRPAR